MSVYDACAIARHMPFDDEQYHRLLSAAGLSTSWTRTMQNAALVGRLRIIREIVGEMCPSPRPSPQRARGEKTLSSPLLPLGRGLEVRGLRALIQRVATALTTARPTGLSSAFTQPRCCCASGFNNRRPSRKHRQIHGPAPRRCGRTDGKSVSRSSGLTPEDHRHPQ